MPDVQDYLEEEIQFTSPIDLIIIVNGEKWEIRRDTTVMIPRYVYLTILQAERQKVKEEKEAALLVDHAQHHITGGQDVIPTVTYDSAGLLSQEDKVKLDNLAGTYGADYVNSSGVTGLTGDTVQELLEALKSYIDTHKTSTDHDSRYYTEAEIAIDDLAGVGRTTETVKDNADDIADVKGYIGYTDDDIYGVEVDYANRTFARLAGAVGKTPGADFDSILAFGGRRRCNLSDAGVVNAYFGDAGYIEDGSNGQVMVEQPKFYYKVVPLKMEKNDAVEIASVKFDTGASADGDITITLNGTAHNVTVANGDDATAVAGKVRGTSFAGWTTGGSGATVTFTATKVGVRSATTFTDTGITGVTATVTRTQPGYIGKGFKLRKARYYVSMTKKPGFKVHPAFVKNNVEKEKIYLSAYEGSLFDVTGDGAYILDDAQVADFTASTGDKLASRANAKPISGLTQDLTRRKCGILAENRGTGWSQQYAATAACTQLLFTVEYASLNSQTKIGLGVVSKASGTGNESEITGSTTLLGNASGMAAGTNGLVSITYRGEENFWGNIFKFTDGMNIYCDIANSVHDLYIADNTFAESTQSSPYANAGITLATKDGYVSAMAYNETYDWLFVPAETLGDSALPVGDYFYQTATSNGYKIARLGGFWYYGSHYGAFYWAVGSAPSTRDRTIGGRLVYVPESEV